MVDSVFTEPFFFFPSLPLLRVPCKGGPVGKTGLFGAPPCPTTLLDVPSARKDREHEEKIIIFFG